jgi:hypothetical protein
VAFVNTRLRRYALFAGIVLAGSVGVYAYETSTGPEQVRQTDVACHWAGRRGVRVSGTVSNPNGSAVNLIIVPTYQLATGGMQNTRMESSGTKYGSPLAADATVHWTVTGLPEGGNWHTGQRIARCAPSARIATGNPDTTEPWRGLRRRPPHLAAVLEPGHHPLGRRIGRLVASLPRSPCLC